MKTVINYYAEDGTRFTTEKECLEYEDKQKKLLEDKERREKEINDMYLEFSKKSKEASDIFDKYTELRKAYTDDYVEEVRLIDRLFPISIEELLGW